MKYRILTVFLLLGTVLFGAGIGGDKERVRVQLKWFPQFQFAGIYAAKEKGYYAAAGLDVTILPRDPNKNNIEQVVNGEAEYGIADSIILLYRAKGVPVKVVGSIFQHCPMVFISKKSSGIVSPLEMKGKRVTFQKDLDDAPLVSVLQYAKLKEGDYRHVPFSFDLSDFINDKVDVRDAYITDEPYTLAKAGIEINIINPLNYGIDFYGDNIFATDKELAEHPGRAKKFLEATIRGWKYALSHKEEMADLLSQKYGSKKPYDALLDESNEVEKMIMPDMVEIGYTSASRFARIAEMYRQTGKMNKEQADKALKELIYNPDESYDKMMKYLYVLLGALLLLSIIIALLYFASRRLNALVKQRTRELDSSFDEAKRANAMLESEKKRYMSMMELASDGVHIMDKKGNLIEFSNSFANLLGYAPDEMLGLNVADWDAMKTREALSEDFSLSTIPHQVFETKHRRKDGSVIDVEISTEGIVLDGHDYIYASARDITGRKLLEQQLKKLNEELASKVEEETAKRLEKEKILIQQSKMAMMGEMMGAIAHQWRQPLNSLGLIIQDASVAYRFGEMDTAYVDKYTDSAMSTIKRMSKTIDDFRDFFKPNKKAKDFVLEEAVEDTLGIMLPQFNSYSIEIAFYEKGKHIVYGYKNELEQTILIIISNAKDALMENKIEQPKIDISIESIGEKVRLVIEDNAGGVPQSIIDRVFEPYFTTKEQGKGTGIGLYMAKEIIERQMGGRIYIENTDIGARFVIEL